MREPTREPTAALLVRCRAGDLVRTVIMGVGGTGKSCVVAELEAAGLAQVVRGGRPLEVPDGAVVCVDDAHRCTDDELDMLTRLAENGSGPGLIVTVRPFRGRAAVGRLVAALAAHEPLIRLGHLTEDEVAAGIAMLLDAPAEQALVETVLSGSAGNPLLARRFVEGLRADGQLTRGRLSGESTTPVRAVVDHLLGTVAQLGASARVLLAEAALMPHAAAAHYLQVSHPEDFTDLVDAGLANDAGLAPIVARATAQVLERSELREAERRAVSTLAALDTAPDQVAEQLWATRAPGAVSVAVYLAAGSHTLQSNPGEALTWFRRAAALDATSLDAHAGIARAALGAGHVAAALDAAATVQALDSTNLDGAIVTAAAFAGRGLWADAATMLDAAALASRPRAAFAHAQAALCWMLAGRPDRVAASAAVSDGPDLATKVTWAAVTLLRDSLSPEPVVLQSARAQLGDLASLSALAPCPVDTPVLPHEVGAAVALALGDLGVADRLLVAAPLAGARRAAIERLRAWTKVRQGETESTPTVNDDDTVSLAIAAAHARRSGDVAHGASVAKLLWSALGVARIDALTIDAACELLVLARRFGPPALAADLDRRITASLDAFGSAAVWSVRPAWARLESAAHTRRPDEVMAAATMLQRVAVLVPHLTPLADAAGVWSDVVAGHIDPERLDAVVSALTDLRFVWEAAHLAGQAAIRTEDAVLAKSLLGRARTLRASSVGPGTTETDRPMTAGGLSQREVEVGRLVLDGLTHKDIGSTLYISPKTVEHHVAHIRQKLGVTTRAMMLARLRDDLADSRG